MNIFSGGTLLPGHTVYIYIYIYLSIYQTHILFISLFFIMKKAYIILTIKNDRAEKKTTSGDAFDGLPSPGSGQGRVVPSIGRH